MKTRVELIKPSCPNPRDPVQVQLVSALEECIAYMDSPCRTNGKDDLVFVIVRDARKVIERVKGGQR